MDKTTFPETQRPGRHAASRDRSADTAGVRGTDGPDEIDVIARRLERRAALRTRHAQGLTRLMEERRDLRGVHALADFVDDAVRWTA